MRQRSRTSSRPAGGCGPTWHQGPTITSAERLRAQLRDLGLTTGVIEAAWPRWWSDDAEGSASARAELRFSVARRLGLDPGSLLVESGTPRFLWRQEARFKHLTAQDEQQQAGIASFGRAVAAAIGRAASALPVRDLTGLSAEEVRRSLTRDDARVDLHALLVLAWALGVPVVHLRVFPWPQKRMAAMATRVAGRSVVLLAKDARYPPWLAFYLAHELGHLACGHVADGEAVVDLDQGDEWGPGTDEEEDAADRWALELLTGRERPEVTADAENRSAAALVHSVTTAGAELNIDAGTLALAFGYTTGDWLTANGALKIMYPEPVDLPAYVNGIAVGELDLADAGEETADYLAGVLDLHELPN